jgi:hypothetical protein
MIGNIAIHSCLRVNKHRQKCVGQTHSSLISINEIYLLVLPLSLGHLPCSIKSRKYVGGPEYAYLGSFKPSR